MNYHLPKILDVKKTKKEKKTKKDINIYIVHGHETQGTVDIREAWPLSLPCMLAFCFPICL